MGGQVKAVKLLIELGADLEAEGYCGVGTPVVWACLGRSAEVLTVLLDAGANMNKKNGDGWTPLYKKMLNFAEGMAVLEQRGVVM